MKISSYYPKRFCKLAVVLLNLLLVLPLPACAQESASTKTLIGLSRVDPENIQSNLTKENIDQLNIKLFKRLDKNDDKSIDAAEFKEWDSKIQSLNPAVSRLFKSITSKKVFEATDVNGDTVITLNEIRALSYFDFISKDANQDNVLDKDEIIAQAPVVLRLISKDCKSINTTYNGMLMGGFCGK